MHNEMFEYLLKKVETKRIFKKNQTKNNVIIKKNWMILFNSKRLESLKLKRERERREEVCQEQQLWN